MSSSRQLETRAIEPLLTSRPPQTPIVLLVEDCLEDRETIKRFLLADRPNSYKIFEATTAVEGIKLCQQCQPDVVLLDYRLPDSDGLEFLEQIQQSENDDCPPVILLTGQGNEFVAVQAMKAGICDYLVKGQVAPQELRTVINYAIENAQLRAQLRQEKATRDRSLEQEKLIAQIANQIHSRLNIDEILDATVSEVRQFLKCDRVLIYRFEPDRSKVVVAESVGDGWSSILQAQVEDTDFMEMLFEDYRQGSIQAITDIDRVELTKARLELLERFQIRARLAVPILQGDSLWGLLVANQCSGPRQWQPQNIELLKQLTTQVGIAIAQAELIERERLVARMQEQIRQSLNVDEILQTTVSQVRQFLRTDRVLVFRLEGNGSGIVAAESISHRATAILSTEIYDPCLVEGYIEPFRKGLVTAKTDIYEESIEPCHVELLARFEVRANLVVPILQGDRLWGMLIAHHCVAPRQWRQAEIDLLKHLATQIGIALLQGELYERVQSELAERISTEIALKNSERRYASLAKLSPVGIWRSDRDGNITYVNDRFCEITGFCSNKFHFNDRERVLQEWLPVEKDNLPFSSEYRFQHPDGTIRWAIVQTSAETDEDGRLTGYIGTVTDISDRKAAERSLQESEERLRLATEAADLGMWFWDITEDELTWTTRCKTLFGFSPDTEVSYELFLNALHPDDRDRTHAAVTQAIQERVEYNIEYRTVWTDGTVHWIAARGQAFYNDCGEPIRMMGTAQDINERKLSEETLKASEEQMKIAQRCAKAGLWNWDIPTNKIVWSDEYYELYGLEPSIQPSYENWLASIDESDRARVDREVREAMKNRDKIDIEYRIIHSKRGIRWLNALGDILYGSDELPKRMTGITLDITERKRAEIALTESEKRFQAFMNICPFAAFIKDEAGYLTYANRRVEELFNKSVGELVGCRDFEILPPAIAQEIQEHDRKVFASGEATEFIETIPDEKGNLTYWLTIKFLLGDRDRQPLLGGIAVDITSRLQAEQQLQQQAQKLIQLNADLEQTTAKLSDRNQELDRFTHTVSHDLKAPLRAISNLSQWISEDLEGQLSEENQHNLELLRLRVARMENLINGLLDYCRIGRTEVASEKVNVGELISEIIDSLSPPTTFTISVSQMPILVAKRLLLSQVFSNLISNAIKHCGRPDGRLEISAIQKGQYYEFSIADNGPGIAPENHERIFGIFQTLKRRDAQENTGIGLSIVKKIIETEGGEITLESELGKGTTFRFTWPFFSDQ
jgi:PAS domain S-box-containing protein